MSDLISRGDRAAQWLWHPGAVSEKKGAVALGAGRITLEQTVRQRL